MLLLLVLRPPGIGEKELFVCGKGVAQHEGGVLQVHGDPTACVDVDGDLLPIYRNGAMRLAAQHIIQMVPYEGVDELGVLKHGFDVGSGRSPTAALGRV